MRKSLIILVLVVFLSGCATIMNGDSQFVRINSQPEGAKVFVAGNYFITPAEVLLKRGYPMHEYQLLFEKEGYKPGYARIEQRLSKWLWGDIIYAVIPGVAVDFITGGAFKLYPKEISVKLEPSVK